MIKLKLFINACIRENSRTYKIARALIEKIGGIFDEVNLAEENLKPLDRETLERRTSLIAKGDYADPMFRYARAFSEADTIVIAAPYWDLSFPAELKVYFENVYVTGLVSRFGSDGRSYGLCKASKLYYVTTAGGSYTPDYNYVKELATVHFGIPETELIKAEMLDVDGFDPDSIVSDTINNL